MQRVQAENTEFLYFPAGAAPPTNVEIMGLSAAEVREFMDGSDTRLSLWLFKLAKPLLYAQWLVWQNPIDLQDLDARIAGGRYTEDDFAGAFRTYAERTFCIHCKARFQTFVIDAGDPYPGAPGLLDRKIDRLKPCQPCLRCRASLRRLLVKIVRPIPGDIVF